MDIMKKSSYLDDLSPSPSRVHQNSRNVLQMLVRREIIPRIKKYFPRRQRGGTSKHDRRSFVKPRIESARDSRRDLLSWVEAESLQYLSTKYSLLTPSPRSTIAAAFSPDGKTIASTHGDHTVKITDCQTGKRLKVLSGHRRTPWVVRFHPLCSEILASGSLDHEVRIWNANTSECIGYRDFNRPIASIAFHAEGELLAVAGGHKVYLWKYSSRGETSSPAIILRTRRSLRAVHFHPHSVPLILTAEVNDLDSSDSTMAPATSLDYSHYPPPAVYMSNIDRLCLAAELPLMPLPRFSSPINEPTENGHPIISQLSASLIAAAPAELPCTVKLRIWRHDIENPFALLKAEQCLLTIPHAVLCSEMGAHFSPCGRYLAVCVACVLPQFEADSSIPTQGAGRSPTRHPISAHQVIYELRVYSLEEAQFGSVLISRPIRAAHCLTSIQFSPTSEHVLLAYGRRHSSLLKSIDINGESSIYTVLEVYRVSDMRLVSVLPSAEDEVNVACFHPFSGGGIAYGTKEGKLRILQINGVHGMNFTRLDHFRMIRMVNEE